MTLKQLPVGKKFVLVRENDASLVYVKVSESNHHNVTYNGMRLSIHNGARVVEVNDKQ